MVTKTPKKDVEVKPAAKKVSISDIEGIVAKARDKRDGSRPVLDLELSSMEINGLDLKAADFRKAKLSKVKFVDCNLTGAMFEGCKAKDVELVGCNTDFSDVLTVLGDE